MATMNQVGVGLSGSTGTGNFVGANTPTLITPVIGAATGTSLTTSGNIITTAGYYTSGSSSGGFSGELLMYTNTGSKGHLSISASDNSVDAAIDIFNASFGQSTALTIPDPGTASANFILSAASVIQHITHGALQIDSGNLSLGLSTGAGASNGIASNVPVAVPCPERPTVPKELMQPPANQWLLSPPESILTPATNSSVDAPKTPLK